MFPITIFEFDVIQCFFNNVSIIFNLRCSRVHDVNSSYQMFFFQNDKIQFSDLVTRPILILGPLADAVIDKLSSDYPHKFCRCEPEYMNCNQVGLANSSHLYQWFSTLKARRPTIDYYKQFDGPPCTV